MLTARLEQIAQEIAASRENASPFQQYDDLQTLPDAFEVQDRVTALGGAVGGYKISWNAPALIQKFGSVVPGGGRIGQDVILENEACLDATRYRSLMLEPEIAAVLATDLPPKERFYSVQEVSQAIAYYVPAFEILDRREAASLHAPSILAGNVFNAGLVLGERAVQQEPSGTTRVEIAGQELVHGHDTAPQPPVEAATYLVNLFTTRGDVLRAGQVLMCGAHGGVICAIAARQSAVMHIEGLGEVRLSVR